MVRYIPDKEYIAGPGLFFCAAPVHKRIDPGAAPGRLHPFSPTAMDKETRQRFALLFARFFDRHLRAELQKRPELVQLPTSRGGTFAEATAELTEELQREFPELAAAGPAPWNLFELWVSTRHDLGVPDYANTTFRLYNEFFFKRLLDLRDQSQTSQEAMRDQVRSFLGRGLFYGRDFTFSLFFRSENDMRERLREIVRAEWPGDQEEAHAVLSRQSAVISQCGYDHFDGVLKEALAQSDALLLNVLPGEIAQELKQKGAVEPVHADSVTVMFTDFQGFTTIAAELPPRVLIEELDCCFTAFDEITEKHGLEKIKTIGDSYMAVGGLPRPNQTHALDSVRAGLEIRDWMEEWATERRAAGRPFWRVRIGIHTGPLAAGVIGKRRFSYDIWGDTVNTASRLESSGEAGRVNVSAETAELVGEHFALLPRGAIAVKNKGPLEMFFVERRTTGASPRPDSGEGRATAR